VNELDIRNLRFADFAYGFNKTRQRFSDVILQGDGVAVIPTLAKKITSELAEVRTIPQNHDYLAISKLARATIASA